MKLATFLYDIVDIVNAARPEINAVRLRASESHCDLSARDGDRNPRSATVVLFARTHEVVEGLEAPVTFHALDSLSSMLMAPGMNRQDVTATLTKDGRSVQATAGSYDYCLPVLDDRLTNQSLGKVLPLKVEVTYQVHFEPNRVGLELLKYWRKELADHIVDGEQFVPYIDNGRLMCQLGKTPFAHTVFPLAEFVSGDLQAAYSYPTGMFIRLASLVMQSRSAVVSFSAQGLCRVQVETDCAIYNFLLPGTER
ncbi:MAG: hypothetical protein C0423_10265 [Methylibium sp.]|nr:hypothetical protein [Methylibium sp.]